LSIMMLLTKILTINQILNLVLLHKLFMVNLVLTNSVILYLVTANINLVLTNSVILYLLMDNLNLVTANLNLV